jgi:hypothetical protein
MASKEIDKYPLNTALFYLKKIWLVLSHSQADVFVRLLVIFTYKFSVPASRGPKGSRRLRLPDFKKIGT